MKHRRGVDLMKGVRGKPVYVGDADDVMRDVHMIREWECIGGRCSNCEREAWLDRWALQRWGTSIVLSEVAKHLRCRACGNITGNKVILGRLPRD